jgi:ubiquinone/menaquinone biosynthesis C-methylase UbiE
MAEAICLDSDNSNQISHAWAVLRSGKSAAWIDQHQSHEGFCVPQGNKAAWLFLFVDLHFRQTVAAMGRPKQTFAGEMMDRIKFAIKKYWNWRSSSFGYDADKSVAIARQWQRVVNGLVADVAGKRALDIGTGTGQLAIYLAQAGFGVTAIDISEKMIARAGQYAASHHLEIDFQVGDAESLNFVDGSFDVVVARNLLWTLPRPDQALREWRRVMKPGGRLIVSDGLWLNTTWKRLHRMLMKAATEYWRGGRSTALRFFWTYAGLQKRLPFYEGLSLDVAVELLRAARFKTIQPHPASSFLIHPYGRTPGKGPPLFFVASATR